MSIFDAGFIMWGYFLIYVLITVAYYGWMTARNRNERRGQDNVKTEGGKS